MRKSISDSKDVEYSFLKPRVFRIGKDNINDIVEGVYEPRILIVQVSKDKTNNTINALARTYGSTDAIIKKYNPNLKILHPGQEIIIVPASKQRVITGWRQMGTKEIGGKYNVGDENYAKKLDYVLSKIIYLFLGAY